LLRLSAFSSGGLAGVWAKVNTREEIFAAVSRKETFATSLVGAQAHRPEARVHSVALGAFRKPSLWNGRLVDATGRWLVDATEDSRPAIAESVERLRRL
jgi:hypothetical protein